MVTRLFDRLAGDKGDSLTVPEAVAGARSVEATECEVVFNRQVNEHYRHLALAAASAVLAARPGQFFQLLCPGQGEGNHFLRRPMSVYRIERVEGRVEFLYKVLGSGTVGLASLEPGGRLNVFGPLGRGFHLKPGWRHVALIGRGVGLATLAPVAEAAVAQGMAVTAILSAARTELVMSVDYLREVGAEVVVVTDSDGSAAPERVEALLRTLVRRRGCDLFATCGSNRLLALVQRLGRELGIEGQVALEQHMACGIGMCYCCVRPFQVGGHVEVRRICLDGPVFDAREVMT